MVEEVALAANSINEILDELQASGTGGSRRQFLTRAALTSIRGLEVLSEEPFVTDTTAYLANLGGQYYHNRAMREVLRQSTVQLRLFMGAECRLLSDLGLSTSAVERARHNLLTTIMSPLEEEADLGRLLADVMAVLEGEARRLHDEGNRGIMRRLQGVFEALSGALVVGANTAVGAAGAPITGGLSAAGATMSVVYGMEMFSRGAMQALDRR
jgi:hypothetical protein